MIEIRVNPDDPSKLVLSQTVVLFLDRVLLETLDDKIIQAICEQARSDLAKSPIKRLVRKAASRKLLEILEPAQEKRNGNEDTSKHEG